MLSCSRFLTYGYEFDLLDFLGAFVFRAGFRHM